MEDNNFSFDSRLFLCVLITLVGLVIYAGAQTVMAFYDHGTLVAVQAGQNTSVQQSLRLRNQLTSLAGSLAQLGINGDADAQSIVDQFGKQGIKFSPPTQPAPPASK